MNKLIGNLVKENMAPKENLMQRRVKTDPVAKHMMMLQKKTLQICCGNTAIQEGQELQKERLMF
jgi:hypothetical protein